MSRTSCARSSATSGRTPWRSNASIMNAPCSWHSRMKRCSRSAARSDDDMVPTSTRTLDRRPASSTGKAGSRRLDGTAARAALRWSVMATLKPGDACGGCRIVRVLGEGGQACVYEVETKERERCAMKIVEPEAGIASAAERLGVECEALATVDHINVLHSFRWGIDRGCVWLLVELVEGETLQDKLRPQRPRPPLPDLVRWMV